MARRYRRDSYGDELAQAVAESIVNSEQGRRSISGSGRASRGAPPIPDAWTRVVSLAHDDLDQLKSYSIASDLHMAPFLPVSTGSYHQKTWSPHFLTENFVEEHKDLELENYVRSSEELKHCGIEISGLRKQFL